MDFDTVFQQPKSRRYVTQIVVLPDSDNLLSKYHQFLGQSTTSTVSHVMNEPDACWRRDKLHESQQIQSITPFLHLNDNDKVIMDKDHPNYDRFYKVRPLLENIRQIYLEERPEGLQSVESTRLSIIPFN
ncbi:hypothetical protein T11_6824 [Trichinella zimbabwensis]|uniref:Uncharacterized protein n=1 Tax=Trichinella zimbabwensis TaxID=268475 RepID=A0A0V1HXI4_9BILA|nr:hypothetical protein T11_6824 [Trichinella zimbabwensis]